MPLSYIGLSLEMSTTSSSLFTASGPTAVDWAQSWDNASESWTNDPQGLLTNQKLYQEELKKYNAAHLIYPAEPGIFGNLTLPYWENRVMSPPPFVVGLYRAEIMELIKQHPVLLNEFVGRVGARNLAKALVFARNNPTVAYGARNAQEFNNTALRKDLIFNDLSVWIRDLASRQDRLVASNVGVKLGGDVQGLAGGLLNTLVSILFIVGVIVGGVFVWRKLAK